MSRTVSLIFNTDKPEAVETAERLVKWGAVNGVDFLVSKEEGRLLSGGVKTETLNTADFVVVLGGDGTFLRAARMFFGSAVPIYGVNFGRLGFMSTGQPATVERDIRNILDGKYSVTEREVIRGCVVRNNELVYSMHALNDLVISKTILSRVVKLQVGVNGELLSNFLSDGIILSTPTGSTAYSLSAGGPIIPPHVSCLAVVPICAHTLFSRPVILSGTDRISVTVKGNGAQMYLTQDGQRGYELYEGDSVVAQIEPEFKIYTIEPEGRSYFDLLRRKFSWGFSGADEGKN